MDAATVLLSAATRTYATAAPSTFSAAFPPSSPTSGIFSPARGTATFAKTALPGPTPTALEALLLRQARARIARGGLSSLAIGTPLLKRPLRRDCRKIRCSAHLIIFFALTDEPRKARQKRY